MALMRYQPMTARFGGGLNQLHDEINRLFDNLGFEDEPTAAADWMPAVDVLEEQARYVLHADVPGVNPKDLDITLENGVLTIRGQRQASDAQEGQGFRRIERRFGVFFRRFALPDTADAENISAQSRNGVLELIIPKQQKLQPRRITVNG